MTPARDSSRTWGAADGAAARDHWLVYALGGGLGHLQRGLALARRAVVCGHRVTLLTNSVWAEVVDAVRFGVELRVIPAEEPARRVQLVVERVLAEQAFDLLVVDTFPRGLAGELGPWLARRTVPAALIGRDLVPEYAARPEVREAAARYDLIVAPGESGPLHAVAPTVATAPWLLLDAGELLGPHAARAAFDVPEDGLALGVVVGAGRGPEVADSRGLAAELSRRVAGRAHVRLADPAAKMRWPLLRLLAGVDLLVGAGGYNTVSEARATGTPLRARPQRRLYDRQARRLRPDERYTTVEELAHALAIAPRPRVKPSYRNGTHQATRVLAEIGGQRRERAGHVSP